MINVNIFSLVFPSLRTSGEMETGYLSNILQSIGFPPESTNCLRVMCNGIIIPHDKWHSFAPNSGSQVDIAVTPALDASSPTTRKEILRTATYTLFPIAGYAAGGEVGGVLGGLLGSWVAQLIPVPAEAIAETTYSINGIQNNIRKYEPIPKVFGKHRVYPPLAAQVYTEIAGDDQYANMLFCLGYKPLRLTQFKIGDTPMSAFEHVQFEANCGLNNNKPLALYPHDVTEENLDKDLIYCPDWYQEDDGRSVRPVIHENVVSFRTQPDTTRVSIDFVFPDGLGIKDGDDWTGARVDVMVRYKPVGASETRVDGRSNWVYVVPDWATDVLTSAAWSQPLLIDLLNQTIAQIQVQIDNMAAISGDLHQISYYLQQLGTSDINRLIDSIDQIRLSPVVPLSLEQDAAYLNLRNVLVAAANDIEGGAVILDDAVATLTQFNQIATFVVECIELAEAIISVNEYMRLGYGPDMDSLPAWHQLIIAVRHAEWMFRTPQTGAFVLVNQGLVQGTLRTNCTWPTSKGQYDVQIRRTTKSGQIVNQGQNQWWDWFDWFENPEGINESVIDSLKVGAVRSFCETRTPMSANAMERYAVAAMRLRSSEDLNGNIDQFNCIAEAPIPWHDGTSWQPRAFYDSSGEMVYRNPAWEYCEALRCNASKVQVADDYIDIPRIIEWALFCKSNKFYFDYVYDKETKIEKVLQDICRVGKATPIVRDGKYSVIYDYEQTVPRAVISTRNSRGFRGTKSFAELPNALRMRYVDAENGYEESELIVYDDGYGVPSDTMATYDSLFDGGAMTIEIPIMYWSNPLIYDTILEAEIPTSDYNFTIGTYPSGNQYISFSRVDGQPWAEGKLRFQITLVYTPKEAELIDDIDGFVGVTDDDHIYKMGRYSLAAAKLRPEVFQRTMDWENIVFERGDMVEVQDDIVMWGYGSGHIVDAVSGPGFTITALWIDEQFIPASGEEYQAKIRLNDNTLLIVDIDSSLVTYKTPEDDGVSTLWTGFSLVTPISAEDAAKIYGGELIVFGEKGVVTTECVVKAIQRNHDLSALITYVEHAPLVHYADVGLIPEFDARITRPPNPAVAQPPTPVVVSYMTDERALTRNPDGSLVSRILVNLDLPRGNTAAQQMGASMVDAVELQFRRAASATEGAPMPWMSMPRFSRNISQPYASPVDDGHYYDFRVRSITKYGVTSLWETVSTIFIKGKTTPPPDIKEVRYSKGIISWQYENAPLDHKGFYVRVVTGTSGTWESATPCHEGVLTTNSFDISKYAWGAKVFFIRAVDVAGNLSEHSARLQMDLGDAPIENIVVDYDFKALGFPGTITGGYITETGYLRSSTGSKTEFYRDAGVPFYRTMWDGVYRTNAEFYTTWYQPFEYLFEITPVSAEDGAQMNVTLSIFLPSLYTLEYRELDVANFWPADMKDNLWPADANHPIWPDWYTWKAWTGKLIAEAGKTYQFRLRSNAEDYVFWVNSLHVVFDVPDITEVIEDFLVSDTGVVRLPITKTYTAIKSVQLTLQYDGSYSDAFTAIVIDKSITGPAIEVYNASQNRVYGVIDATVQGH